MTAKKAMRKVMKILNRTHKGGAYETAEQKISYLEIVASNYEQAMREKEQDKSIEVVFSS